MPHAAAASNAMRLIIDARQWLLELWWLLKSAIDECSLFRALALAAADWLLLHAINACCGWPRRCVLAAAGVLFRGRAAGMPSVLQTASSLGSGFHRSSLKIACQRARGFVGSVLAVYDYSLQRRADWTTASVAADLCSVQRSSCGAGSYRASVLVGQ